MGLKKLILNPQETNDSKNLRCETLYIADYEYVKRFQSCCVRYEVMNGRKWRLTHKSPFIFIQINSVESLNLTKSVEFFLL